MAEPHDDDDTYDLAAVEAELARMQQRRVQRMHAAALSAPLADFELNEAELSAGTDSDDDDSSDSDDHLCHSSTALSALKTSRRRLADSLDLSMSIADVPAPPVRAARTRSNALPPPSAATTTRVTPSPLVRIQQHTEPVQREQGGGRALREDSALGAQSTSSEHNNQTNLMTSDLAQHNRGDDSWTSDLVRRRRQLEQDAALERSARRSHGHGHSAGAHASLSLAAPPEHATQSRLPSSAHTQGRAHSTGVRAPLPRSRDLDDGCRERGLGTTPVPATHPQTNNNQRRPPVMQTSTPSSLRPPAQYAAKSSGAVSSVLRSTRAAPDDPSTTATGAHSTPLSALRDAKSANRRSEPEDRSYEDQDSDEDDDLVSAEEERLRQSLAKLDSRLTRLSAATSRTPPQHRDARCATESSAHATERPRAIAASSGTASTSDRVLDPTREKRTRTTHSEAESDDRSAIAAAAYGGGAHCKSGQVTTALERASYSRRVEMSSGTHRLRVRPGAAAPAHDASSSSSADKDAKHRVVVKRDLAHLLF